MLPISVPMITWAHHPCIEQPIYQIRVWGLGFSRKCITHGFCDSPLQETIERDDLETRLRRHIQNDVGRGRDDNVARELRWETEIWKRGRVNVCQLPPSAVLRNRVASTASSIKTTVKRARNLTRLTLAWCWRGDGYHGVGNITSELSRCCD